MPIRFSVRGREFAPSWPMTLLTLVLLMFFVSLGRWQWQRGEDKQARWNAFAASSSAPAVDAVSSIDEVQLYRVVELSGTYEPERQFLLDNIIRGGKAGYAVLTPFVLDNGRRFLVNRGWVPFSGFRDRLPDVSWQGSAHTTVLGRVDELPHGGLASGRAPPPTDANWPKVTSFPTHEELEAALGKRIERRIVLLDPRAPGGYLREWSPPGLSPTRHYSYALQWWGFALVLLVLYFGLNFRKVS
jgi:surfeit locus 1 family protein